MRDVLAQLGFLLRGRIGMRRLAVKGPLLAAAIIGTACSVTGCGSSGGGAIASLAPSKSISFSPSRAASIPPTEAASIPPSVSVPATAELIAAGVPVETAAFFDRIAEGRESLPLSPPGLQGLP